MSRISSWDDWVPQDRVRKYSEENIELARNIKKDAERNDRAKRAAAKKTRGGGSELSSTRGSEERHSSVQAYSGRGHKRGRDYEIEKVSSPMSISSDIAAVVSRSSSKSKNESSISSVFQKMRTAIGSEDQEVSDADIIPLSSATDEGCDGLGDLASNDASKSKTVPQLTLNGGPEPIIFGSSRAASRVPPQFVFSTTRATNLFAVAQSALSSPASTPPRSSQLSDPSGFEAPISPDTQPSPSLRYPRQPYRLRCTVEGRHELPSPNSHNGPRIIHSKLSTSSNSVHPKLIRLGKEDSYNVAKRAYFQDQDPKAVIMIAGRARERRMNGRNGHRSGFTSAGRASERRVNQQTANMSDSQEDGFHIRPSVRLVIPDHLKALLVDDWENVTKNLQLAPLPSKTPVNFILSAYYEEELPKRAPGSGEADTLEETVQGVKDYFAACIGRILLYRFEREQFFEFRKLWEAGVGEWENKGPGDVYGAEHLCRLFGGFFSSLIIFLSTLTLAS